IGVLTMVLVEFPVVVDFTRCACWSALGLLAVDDAAARGLRFLLLSSLVRCGEED
ncbi:hypothetical protein Dimus_004350, partial [Dionaea muscipula]